MQIWFSPNYETLLDGEVEYGTGESVFDYWFRLPCTAHIFGKAGNVSIQDDMGFFFQKCKFLATCQIGEEIYFLNLKARRDEHSILLHRTGIKFSIVSSELSDFFSSVSKELNHQIDAMEGAYDVPDMISEHYRNEYLKPIQNFHLAENL